VKATEFQAAEVYVPDPVVDLLHPDILTSEHVTYVDPLRAPADASVAADQARLVVRRIVERRQSLGERPGRRPIARCRCLLAESFMRAVVVVLIAEDVEAMLLTRAMPGGGTRGLGGHAVVGADELRQSELPEQATQDWLGANVRSRVECLAAEQEAAVAIHHGERVAVDPSRVLKCPLKSAVQIWLGSVIGVRGRPG